MDDKEIKKSEELQKSEELTDEETEKVASGAAVAVPKIFG